MVVPRLRLGKSSGVDCGAWPGRDPPATDGTVLDVDFVRDAPRNPALGWRQCSSDRSSKRLTRVVPRRFTLKPHRHDHHREVSHLDRGPVLTHEASKTIGRCSPLPRQQNASTGLFCASGGSAVGVGLKCAPRVEPGELCVREGLHVLCKGPFETETRQCPRNCRFREWFIPRCEGDKPGSRMRENGTSGSAGVRAQGN